METKKGSYQSAPATPSNEVAQNEAIPKHQHNTAPQHLRLLQYGLKIPNYQHSQLNQQLNSPLHLHLHQQAQYQQTSHRHLQPSPQQLNNYPQYVHQHPLYQPNQPPPLHPHTQITQNSPQIWVPHQPPPIHYHQQNKNEPKPQPQPPQAPKPKETVERKKSNNHLRSPAAKRPLEAPVTMQGWLHKQGSEGLMLWKKRWFVLSEYCLFYYKGPEEEKLLGSILLPSYKVSICSSDDRASKKHAFKCEHANMRTYILAADSQDSMMQWIRVLNLACLLQSNVVYVPKTFKINPNLIAINKIPNNSSETDQQSQSVPSTYNQSTENSDSGFYQQNQSRATPMHMHSSSNTTDLSQQELNQYSQPLYANAPPKPRRLNDAGYSSPSPDAYPDYRPKHSEYGYAERRTPDTYGRSKPGKRHPSDYEDVYADQAMSSGYPAMYKRPLSPIQYSHVKKTTPLVNPAYRAYTPVNMLGPKYPQMRKSPSAIARPHSADFLEYELNHPRAGQQPRPKSSLDINRNTNDCDNYFYSEERYAEKMRKSAQYLPNMPAPRKYPENESNFLLMRSNTQPIHFNNLQINQVPSVSAHPVRSRSVLSEGSLSKELDVDLRQRNPEAMSPGYALTPDFYSYDDRGREYDQFTRSASARLTQNGVPLDYKREGDRKREESMKRLLEWKQRMLQSPLNRKVQNHRVPFPGRPEVYYKNHQEPEYLHRGQVHHYQDGRRSANNLPQYNSYSSDDEASGSISINTRDTFPKAISAKRIWTPNAQAMHARSVTNIARAAENDPYPNNYYVSPGSSQHDFHAENAYVHKARKENWPLPDKMHVSAGELLGRTHEELVLMLIQLRRQSANTLQTIENCYNEVDTLQAQLHGSLMSQAKRLENLQKLEQIKQHLIELEKQYEKGKPLVNLVDNMVKLGSLYRSPNEQQAHLRDRLEFNQQVQERRLLADERRDWNRLNPNHLQLQEKVQQLYQLDRLIHEESGTLQSLQQDKEDIERALGGLRLRLNQGFSDPAEVELARKQQAGLENDLSRVHLMLAQNSKKLEETVAGNARLEQELLILKQKLQVSRQQRTSPQFSNAGDSLPCAMGTSAMLESDLQRVQQKVGDLQKQRQELSMQVRQLTDRSNNLQQQMKSPTVAQQNSSLGNRKRVNSVWRETDLDTMYSVDHGDCWDSNLSTDSISPLYVNTELKQSDDYYGSTSDDTTQNSGSVEKPEIKTVRIVKRESERRQRDREKTAPGKWDALFEEDTSSQGSSVLFRPAPVQKAAEGGAPSPSLPQALSPVFKSEAARQIITEMAVAPARQPNRRAVPKEKRRHYTAPHNHLIMKSLHHLPTNDDAFDKMLGNARRARDDLDMERALRQRIDAPDVVRSTLSTKELKYNESTIDNILGTPNKINIPERYIPEQVPQLSAEEQEHRLRKVESIKKMLSDAPIISTSSTNLAATDEKQNKTPNSVTNKATTKMIEERKQREHLLQLNQILAKQVMEMSKIVAVKAVSSLPLEPELTDEELSSPVTPLPLYQQRDNFYS